ncbi:MAG: hypothetical protein AB1721_01385 [Patescibacteria group bacterium]
MEKNKIKNFLESVLDWLLIFILLGGLIYTTLRVLADNGWDLARVLGW